jgi:LacI family gluconate utilization system Gnt-I transcriptional repressor
VGVTDYLPEKEEKVLFEMLSWRPSGVIIAGLEHSDASRAMLRQAGCPVVEIMDVDGHPVDACVGISHRRAWSENGGIDPPERLSQNRLYWDEDAARPPSSEAVRRLSHRRSPKAGIEISDQGVLFWRFSAGERARTD